MTTLEKVDELITLTDHKLNNPDIIISRDRWMFFSADIAHNFHLVTDTEWKGQHMEYKGHKIIIVDTVDNYIGLAVTREEQIQGFI